MGVILIAFERESEQSALEQLLAGRGHRVVRSANGLAALDSARREPPHAVVSDIVLPRMDGFALCRKWKQDERLQTIPFLFYTRRHDDPKYERFALELGAERFLARSVPPEALLTALDELLDGVPAQPEPTRRMPAMDEAAAAQRTAAVERAQQLQAQAMEKAQAAQAAQAQAMEQAQIAQAGQARLHAQIEELEATNQRLAAGEARFRRVFEANPLPMWIADRATGGFIAVNDAALALHGYTRAEFLALKQAALAASGAAVPPGLRLHQRKGGGVVALSLSSIEIEFDGRSADLVSAYDLTERVASAEQQLRIAAEQAGADARSAAQKDAQHAQHAAVEAARQAVHQEAVEQMARQAEQVAQQVAQASKEAALKAAQEAAQHATQEAEQRAAATIEQINRELSAQRTGQRGVEFLVDLFRQADQSDEATIVRRVIDQAAEATRSPVVSLHLIDTANKTISLVAWRDAGRTNVALADAEAKPLLRAGLFSECVRAKRATSSNDLSWKPQEDGLPDLQRYVAVPAIQGEETVAVLGVANRDEGYEEADQKALAALVDGTWRILHGKRVHAHTLRSLQRTDVALHNMIDSFVRMSERHDPYTSGSSRRVAALAVALAREAGLDGERQHALRVASLLHDIGNIAVPASILSKPAPLTETELALMRTHVEEGCQLLADIDFGAPVAEIVYQSHERYDGSGYPRALKGEDILLEARILAIADTVEAMCSPRPYRPAAGMDAAIDEINRGAGSLYDLHLVAACTRLVRQHGFTLPE